ncbi:hypothetical protein LTR78_003011 [Recurvomyces mirabilis]|uniref:Alpha-galactosidase n=1 Tax=Recurvomyces mirabilis TaxID=574656 RepID=A0AAE0WRY0_9PEZI|nr:hypothetical protein LTR78_003011 [Recurvomyces mirabilis]KAK5157169.1 hypothetical protein LTS14_004687 [Recurvomyces mirabilis]
MTAANQFKNLGLAAVGYQYVNIDDCWTQQGRNGSGYLVADPSKWPNGVAYVANQVHSMGLKFGLYGDAGKQTCGGHPGSMGYETKDAQLLSSWGVDYWKYDNCYTNCNGQYPQTCWNIPSRDVKPWYTTMGNAISTVSHPILFSLCEWGQDSVWTWGRSVGGSSWRMANDVQNNWGSVSSIAATAAGIAQYAGPGGFNDLDMLEIGNGGLSAAEERAHFGLWAIAKSPLIIGTDLSKISSSSLAVLKNADIIAVNQDSLGKAATYFKPKNAANPIGGQLYPYWAGQLSNGVVVGVVAASGALNYNVNFFDVPGLGSGSFKWKELYSGKTGSGSSVSGSLQSHDMAIYRVSK